MGDCERTVVRAYKTRGQDVLFDRDGIPEHDIVEQVPVEDEPRYVDAQGQITLDQYAAAERSSPTGAGDSRA